MIFNKHSSFFRLCEIEFNNLKTHLLNKFYLTIVKHTLINTRKQIQQNEIVPFDLVYRPTVCTGRRRWLPPSIFIYFLFQNFLIKKVGRHF